MARLALIKQSYLRVACSLFKHTHTPGTCTWINTNHVVAPHTHRHAHTQLLNLRPCRSNKEPFDPKGQSVDKEESGGQTSAQILEKSKTCFLFLFTFRLWQVPSTWSGCCWTSTSCWLWRLSSTTTRSRTCRTCWTSTWKMQVSNWRREIQPPPWYTIISSRP